MNQRILAHAKQCLPGLALILILAASVYAEPSTQPAPKSDASIETLVKTYRELNLPIPPADAPLVKLTNDYRRSGGERDKTYQLGFLLKGKPGDNPPLLLLIGTEPYRVEYPSEVVEPVAPAAINAADVEMGHWSTFAINAGLATATQCRMRGYNALADALLSRALQLDSLPGVSIYNPETDQPPSAMAALGNLAWTHWGNELARPGTDRADIARQIHALFSRMPSLKTENNLAVLASLDAALVPSHAKPGSIDAMIDDLLDIDTDPDRLRSDNPHDSDARQKLVMLGFEAVPALLAHIDDDRLTRGVDYGMMMVPSLNSRVSNIVGQILEDLSGDDLGKHWLHPERGWVVEKEAALAWWKSAREKGEEAYLVDHVLLMADAHTGESSDVMLDIIAKRYPAHLFELYKIVLDDRPDLESGRIALKIIDSSLPADQKRSAFLHATKSVTLRHRKWGLQGLSSIDADAFVTLYAKGLDALTRTPAGPYWRCDETQFCSLAILSADPRAWEALKRTAARVDVGLRMQILSEFNNFGGCCGPNPHPRESLALFAAFLNDVEVRDVATDKAHYEGPCAASEFPRLAVRDFAAMSINLSLTKKVDSFPSKDWKPEDWTRYRETVRAAMKEEAQR